MKFIALINTQIYYDCDCHYGRLVFAKTFDTVDEAKSAIEEKLKSFTVQEEEFTDEYHGWNNNKLSHVNTADYEDVNVFHDEEANTFAAAIISFDENNGNLLCIAHSCFDGPEIPSIIAQDNIRRHCKTAIDNYIKSEQDRIDEYRDKDEYPTVSVLQKGQVAKAYEIGYAWVKNERGINLVDGCEGVSISVSIVNWHTGEIL